ncbi:DUF3530 family protein [Shewanella sp. JM162201]|uniref:DUF3530 family protein n=1 Tax=Shewanella jiangmenensis TaxID=2837387 RepID=A0ABS5V3H8_9GAMM|nr:DUF3530 family protein [Shewanella jiangmenensis]MBT1444181.1 DUF3530 family protein [Shewanella jiangmenensis]
MGATKALLTSLLLAVLAASAGTKAYGADDPVFDYLKSRQQRSISIEGKTLPVLVRPWEGKQQYGAVIIFADTGFGPDAPGLVAYLRDGLSPIGWASISMTPPQNPPHPSFTTAPEQVTQAGDKQLASHQGEAMATHSKEEWQKHVDTQLKFVEQSLGELAQIGAAYPGKRILVAMDRSAGLVIKLLADGRIAQPDLLVTINPYSESPEFDALLPGLIATLEVPVLDIQAPDANRASLASAALRLASSSMKDALSYRQLLLALNISEPDAWADSLSAIRGFAATIKRAGANPAMQRGNDDASGGNGNSEGGNANTNAADAGQGAEADSEPASFMPPGMTAPDLEAAQAQDNQTQDSQAQESPTSQGDSGQAQEAQNPEQPATDPQQSDPQSKSDPQPANPAQTEPTPADPNSKKTP